MDLKEVLKQYVVENIWCSPKQDRQVMFALSRITNYGGVKHRFSYEWTSLNLPTDDAPYHVYQVGQNCPVEIGLFPERGVWISLSDLCTTTSLLPTLYLENGIQLPRTLSYICRTHDKNFLICVKESLQISDLNKDTLYVHLYTDAYYASIRGNPYIEKLKCGGGKIYTKQDLFSLQTEIQAIQPKLGAISTWINGRYVSDINGTKVALGDIVEYVYDPAITAIVDLPMAELTAFTSSLDKLAKFILHPPKRGDSVIYFRDDVDIYLIKKDTKGGYDGIYYHRNREPSLRMLTHRDYSIPSTYVKGFIQDDAVWQGDGNDVIIRLVIRESGYDRKLVHEAHRIHELYRLTDDLILRAMQALDSTLPEWTADSLESSLYPYQMSCWYPEINGEDAIKTLGHNAITGIVGQSPIKVTDKGDGFPYVDVPWGLEINSTMYEYDSDGLLIGWYLHDGGSRYYTKNKTCTLVEGIVGIGTRSIEAYYGKIELKLNPDIGYRFWISSVRNGATTNQWHQIDEDSGYYKIDSAGNVTWMYDETRYVGAVVSDNTFLAYQQTMTQTDGFYRFSIDYTDIQGVVLQIPFGKVELWLNGRSLIPELDYYVQWPDVVIVNKEWLYAEGNNVIEMRCTDWPETDGSLLPIANFGWVRYGELDNDELYHIRDDHVIRTVADGRTFHRDDLVYAQQRYGIKVKESSGIEDGRPYWISDYHIPYYGIKDYDGDALRAEAEDLDKRIGDYMLAKIEIPEHDGIATTKWRYQVYSPLITKLLADIQSGVFVPPTMPTSDSIVIESMAEYEFILPFDPARNTPNTEYVTIFPHPWSKTRSVTLSEYQYLRKICELYLHDLVDITQFITIEG